MTSKKLSKMGWLCFGLMWIPFTTLMIGVSNLGPGVHSMSFEAMSPMMKYSFIAIGVFFTLTFVFHFFGSILPIFRQLFAGVKRKRHLKRYGRQATARVLQLYETGLTVNQQPIVGFELEVHPSTGVAFKANTQQLIRRLDVPRIQPGIELNVKYDPKTKEVMISKGQNVNI